MKLLDPLPRCWGTMEAAPSTPTESLHTFFSRHSNAGEIDVVRLPPGD